MDYILFQGSGTFSNEAVISSLPKKSTIDVFSNGIYGDRLADISNKYDMLNKFVKIDHRAQLTGEIIERNIKNSHSTHIAVVIMKLQQGYKIVLKIFQLLKNTIKKLFLMQLVVLEEFLININSLDIDYLVGALNV